MQTRLTRLGTLAALMAALASPALAQKPVPGSIRLGGSGDRSDSAIRWKYQRSVPQLPSPLLYRNVLYMVNDNGIVTTLNPDTGAVIKQGRLTGAPGAVFASPIAPDGHVYFTTEAGAVVVVSPGGDLAV